MQITRTNYGFTRVEMIVTGLITLLLAMVIIQWLMSSREHARLVQCKNNLKTFGLSMLSNGELKLEGSYCTGAFDYLGDGCIDSYGWVADMVNINGLNPGQMLCPSQELIVEQSYEDMLNMQSMQSPRLTPALQQRLKEGACAELLSQGAEGSVARKSYINAVFKSRGYATNYATSWFLTRSQFKLTSYHDDGSKVSDNKFIVRRPLKELSATEGPLRFLLMNSSDVPYNIISILGDSRKVTYASGETSVRSANQGAITYNIASERLMHFDDLDNYGHSVDEFENDLHICSEDSAVFNYRHNSLNAANFAKHFGGGDNLWLQDSRAWGVNHFDIKMNHVSNVLFADGSVKSIIDINGDGMLNPGFPTTRHGLGDEDNFHGLNVELEPFQHFNEFGFLESLYRIRFHD